MFGAGVEWGSNKMAKVNFKMSVRRKNWKRQLNNYLDGNPGSGAIDRACNTNFRHILKTISIRRLRR